MGDQNVAKEVVFDDAHAAKNKRKILLKIVFLKINNIDTILEQYEADVFLQAKWREPSLDSTNKENIKWEAYFDPKLNIQNHTGDLKQTIWRELEHGAGRKAFIVERRRIRGKFFERLELQDFPFDVQDLSIKITSESPPAEVELVEDDTSASNINVDSFVDQQEWGIYDYVYGEQHLTTNEYSSVKFKRPGFIFHCCAVRRAGYFTYNIMLVIAMISSLAFATFSVDRELTQNRLQLSFTLVLTMVTFKFAASQSVPKLSYLTYLDMYILLSMFFLFMVCCWHALMSLFNSNGDLATTMDYYAFFVFVGFYLVWQAVFITVVSVRLHIKKQSKERMQEEYRKKLDSLPVDEDRPLRRKLRRKQTVWRMKIRPS